MSTTIEDLTVDYEENGQLVVKELDKAVLSKAGAWTTVLFRYQEWQAADDSYGPDRYVIRRYQKRGGEYKMQSKFKISSQDQARKIIAVLQGWLPDAGGEAQSPAPEAAPKAKTTAKKSAAVKPKAEKPKADDAAPDAPKAAKAKTGKATTAKAKA